MNEKWAGNAAVIFGFVLVNIILLAAVYIVFGHGPLLEWRQANMQIILLENRLSALRQDAAGQADNLNILAAYEDALARLTPLPYDGPAEALINITRIAGDYGLRERAFETGEPSALEADVFETGEPSALPMEGSLETGFIMEWTAEAAYEGAYEDLLGFVGKLTGDGYDIRQVTLEAAREDAAAYVRIVVCVYGVETPYG